MAFDQNQILKQEVFKNPSPLYNPNASPSPVCVPSPGRLFPGHAPYSLGYGPTLPFRNYAAHFPYPERTLFPMNEMSEPLRSLDQVEILGQVHGYENMDHHHKQIPFPANVALQGQGKVNAEETSTDNPPIKTSKFGNFPFPTNVALQGQGKVNAEKPSLDNSPIKTSKFGNFPFPANIAPQGQGKVNAEEASMDSPPIKTSKLGNLSGGGEECEKESLLKMKEDNEAEIEAAEIQLKSLKQKKEFIDKLLNWYQKNSGLSELSS